MTHFSLTRRMPHPPELLYSIAADVASYSGFVPLCASSRVWNASLDDEGRKHFRGALTIAYPKLGLAETLACNVTADASRLMVRAHSEEGPVKHLENRWRFRPDGQGGTEVEFEVEFTMASPILQGVVTGLFDYALRKILNAFEARAAALAATDKP